jgi:hypothetical protein
MATTANEIAAQIGTMLADKGHQVLDAGTRLTVMDPEGNIFEITVKALP